MKKFMDNFLKAPKNSKNNEESPQKISNEKKNHNSGKMDCKSCSKNKEKGLKIRNENERKIIIKDRNCKVWVQDNYIPLNERKSLFEHCRDKLNWKAHKIVVFNKECTQPRLTCSIGGTSTYSNSIHPSHPWTEEIANIKDRLNSEFNLHINSCLMNFYRDGKDYIGAHSDADDNLIVCSISLGQERTLVMEEKGGKKRKIKVELPNGSLFVMEGETQRYWKHGIPKQLSRKRPRISLTMREKKNIQI
jgi:alkylated DNA repair dioxygenase AlkB